MARINFKRTMKGAGFLKTAVFAFLVMALFMFGALGFTGGFLVVNNYPVNQTLKTQYLAILGNATNPQGSLFGSYTNLTVQTHNQSNQLATPSSNIGFVQAVSLAGKFFTSIPSLVGSMANFVAIPLTFIGIPASYAVAIVIVLAVVMVILAMLFILTLVPS